MAVTPEKRVKNAVVKTLKEMGCYYTFPVTGGFGRSGVPDIIGCYKGTFFGIECKAGANKPTPLQMKNLLQIEEAGGIPMVVNETNTHQVKAVLEGVKLCTLWSTLKH